MTDQVRPAQVSVSKNGPYIVTGDVFLAKQTIVPDAAGGSNHWREGDPIAHKETYALCRCGRSGAKPFCDGTHASIGFDGTETASHEPYDVQAQVFDGPTLQMTDVRPLCAAARFCDTYGKVWNEIASTDNPEVRDRVIHQVNDCPSGRLAVQDKASGERLGKVLPISIGVVEDPQEDCSGPLWLRGGIPVVAADGYPYEVRYRATLCRCGASANKPFCDGTHISVKFKDV